MTALLPSGSTPKEVELVVIETEFFSLVIKGRPYHPRYEGLKQYRSMDLHDVMEFDAFGENVEKIHVFDVVTESLQPFKDQRPIFFENSAYQVIVSPKKENMDLSFYHDHPSLRNAISRVTLGGSYLLMGNLSFQSEVGLSTFEIRSKERAILTVTMEVYPSKLEYKEDYKRLIDEVNDEIYNLSYHLLKKTYLGAQIKLEGQPSLAEFYRLITHYFKAFTTALHRIERQPHHKLEKSYETVRGDKIKRLDSRSRNALRKNSHLFVETPRGINVSGRKVMPSRGLNVKKELVYDTPENRYVKWMALRLIDKLESIKEKLTSKYWNLAIEDKELENKVHSMSKQLSSITRNSFWRAIKDPKQPTMSLVMQMAPGYRDAFYIYLTVSKGLALQGKLYQMSIKDVAELYEYWTFLKLGQILSKNYKQLSQDIVKVNRRGLFIRLDTNQSAKRVFKHPITGERITLTYQKTERNPTTTQKPDTMLSIEKKGKDYQFHYVFDAKYRVDFAVEDSYYSRRYLQPGPLEEDINTMHRYRDSIVSRTNEAYERTAFGAYVLFPFKGEESYVEHHFYKSINEVNIGGLPFLPSATSLVEQFVQHIIEKSPEEIHKEGILPIGMQEEWLSSIAEKVIVGVVSTEEQYLSCMQTASFTIATNQLKKGWHESKYLALYLSQTSNRENGVSYYGEILEVSVRDKVVEFKMKSWLKLKQVIKPVNYGIAGSTITTLAQLKVATELPELFMKSKEEVTIWRMLRRVSDRIKVELDSKEMDQAYQVNSFRFKDVEVRMNGRDKQIQLTKENKNQSVDYELLLENPSQVFKTILELLAKE
ncbi:restriction endonuclease-like protein [Alkalihalophilus marmarensis]|uniref:restriction endonuclease-like protein n=1 Tax=Alkalihalophilus marmarensis TaxID=521377 RepID=UPI002E2449E2|nr:restriction endonuclease-like protein [Alkalihalophilus marmarensis]